MAKAVAAARLIFCLMSYLSTDARYNTLSQQQLDHPMDLNSSDVRFTVVCCVMSLKFAGGDGTHPARCRRVRWAEHPWHRRHRQVRDLGKIRKGTFRKPLLVMLKTTGSPRKKGFGNTRFQWATCNIHMSSLIFQEYKKHLVQGGSHSTCSPCLPSIAITETSQHLITHKATIVMGKSITNVKFPPIAGNLPGEIRSDPVYAPKSSPFWPERSHFCTLNQRVCLTQSMEEWSVRQASKRF